MGLFVISDPKNLDLCNCMKLLLELLVLLAELNAAADGRSCCR
jgi:hypothetical protein